MSTHWIEALRSTLYEVVDLCDGNLCHPLVVHWSELLDIEITKAAHAALSLAI